MRAISDSLRKEWLNEEVATGYLKRAGFELRRDRSLKRLRPPVLVWGVALARLPVLDRGLFDA